ncbi:DMT family transporter [Agrococcus sp. TSP3-2-1]|uniref:DMT family transporter n=1 Tax=Agrococcus sp. TSP3-2-1 TaxID=2804583 RepID=UPI003CF04C45
MAWLALIASIVAEVGGTLSLRMATVGERPKRRWSFVVAACYLVAFTLLSVSLANGMPLGVAYGIWTAVGVALTAVLSRVLFREPLTRTMLAGIALIALGVLIVELGATH